MADAIVMTPAMDALWNEFVEKHADKVATFTAPATIQTPHIVRRWFREWVTNDGRSKGATGSLWRKWLNDPCPEGRIDFDELAGAVAKDTIRKLWIYGDNYLDRNVDVAALQIKARVLSDGEVFIRRTKDGAELIPFEEWSTH